LPCGAPERQAIGQSAREKGALFQTDATHSFSCLPLGVRSVPVDLVVANVRELLRAAMPHLSEVEAWRLVAKHLLKSPGLCEPGLLV